MDLLRSLPIGLYLEQPIAWLHRLDPRVKLAWLLSFLAAPIMANSLYRVSLVILLILITLTAGIPWRVWRQQMGWLLTLSFFVLILGAVSPDGLGVDPQPRLPTAEQGQILVLGNEFDARVGSREQGAGSRGAEGQRSDKQLPTTNYQLPTDYQYVLFQYWIITVTRRSVELALRLSTSLFTLIYSTNLYLLTTAPEEITAGLESLMLPLRRFKLPVTEIALTLTLSLRFIPLVMEEVQNLIRSVRTRAINWKKLGIKGALRVWMVVAERLLENLLLRAEQMAKAMTVRGFTTPNTHRVQWHQLRFAARDWIALVCLVAFWAIRLTWGNEV
ncbi:MAG: Energy-coupling factor transporter transmembrane protein EcfT [Chroococcidiopsis sp. SAG 2025]|uniref:energy-coupling factor transporter transmembrane component T family protein n=1 Tax=Chroococcidiopsis sp. SAG 2025 TaxID=171389 RepID=UPI00293735A7|nr:energy-coupling factor transporter transmembrane protein EcfT [Chroococcidiopsis sp. SAG 2025]MDV2991713.1 Energy-coupling factor transporter transmembrane protein EcfT [Chroococcidiopsis sp. SAG 2025]